MKRRTGKIPRTNEDRKSAKISVAHHRLLKQLYEVLNLEYIYIVGDALEEKAVRLGFTETKPGSGEWISPSGDES